MATHKQKLEYLTDLAKHYFGDEMTIKQHDAALKLYAIGKNNPDGTLAILTDFMKVDELTAFACGVIRHDEFLTK